MSSLHQENRLLLEDGKSKPREFWTHIVHVTITSGPPESSYSSALASSSQLRMGSCGSGHNSGSSFPYEGSQVT